MTRGATFEHHGGLHLRNTVLWLDAADAQQLCFVSHANVAGAMTHQKIIATERTVQILRGLGAAHGRGRRAHEPQALVSPFGRPFSLGQLSLELFPSGHLLGAASLLVKHEGADIVYAGSINPRKSEVSDRLEARPCDVLVLTYPFGDKRLVLPPHEQTMAALQRFVGDTLARGISPVLLCAPLGEAQEVLHGLAGLDQPCRVHRQVFAASRVYQDAGLPLAELRRFSGDESEPSPIVWPVALHRSPALGKLSNCRRALTSVVALDAAAREQIEHDAAFPVSTHADYAAHLEYVRACEPSEVVLTQSASRELKGDLEALGMSVSAVGPVQQMSLF